MPPHGGDARLVQPMHTVAGGSGLNTATHLSSLLRHFWTNDSKDNLRTSNVNFQTVINENDEHGKLIASHCNRHQFMLINRRLAKYRGCYLGTNQAVLQSQKGAKSTGHCAVIVSNGDRSFMTHLGCMEDFRGSQILKKFQDPDNKTSTQHQHVHIAGYYNIPGFWDGGLEYKLAEIRGIQAKTNHRTTISLVPQQDATNKWDGGLMKVLQYIDFLILSEVEAKNITRYSCGENDGKNHSDFFQHVAKFFRKNSRTYIIVTRGPKGACAFYDGEMVHDQETVLEIDNPTDPTGAGDAFAAGFLHGYLSYRAESKDKVDCVITTEAVKAGMQWACAAGTCSIMVQGASVPPKKEIIELMLNKIIVRGLNEKNWAGRCRVAE